MIFVDPEVIEKGLDLAVTLSKHLSSSALFSRLSIEQFRGGDSVCSSSMECKSFSTAITCGLDSMLAMFTLGADNKRKFSFFSSIKLGRGVGSEEIAPTAGEEISSTAGEAANLWYWF